MAHQLQRLFRVSRRGHRQTRPLTVLTQQLGIGRVVFDQHNIHCRLSLSFPNREGLLGEFSGRQGKGEGAALARCAFHTYAPLVGLDNLLDQSQPEPRTADMAGLLRNPPRKIRRECWGGPRRRPLPADRYPPPLVGPLLSPCPRPPSTPPGTRNCTV